MKNLLKIIDWYYTLSIYLNFLYSLMQNYMDNGKYLKNNQITKYS